MWANCVRYVADGDLTVGELAARARTGTNVDGMRRWGYVEVHPADRRPSASTVLRATEAGRRAAEVWAPLGRVVEDRWRERFGGDQVSRLRDAPASVAGQLDAGLPDCLPVLGHGMRTTVTLRGEPAGDLTDAPLWELLSRVLLGFTVQFEGVRGTRSLAIGADVLRLIDEQGVRVRDLPRRSGVSKEAVAMALGVLEKVSAVEIDSVRQGADRAADRRGPVTAGRVPPPPGNR